MQPILTYFETTWIGGYDRPQKRRAPVFEIALWNCYDSILNDLEKTNNASEGNNRALSSLLGASHPTIFKFQTDLKKKQALPEMALEQLLAGSILMSGKV